MTWSKWGNPDSVQGLGVGEQTSETAFPGRRIGSNVQSGSGDQEFY